MRTDLYGLATVDGDTVKVPDRGLGGVLVDHGDESITFSGVVDVGDFAAPAKLILENLTGAVLVDPVYEKLRTLRHGACFGFGGPVTQKMAKRITSCRATQKWRE